MADRFEDVSDEDIELLLEKRDSNSTKNVIKGAARILQTVQWICGYVHVYKIIKQLFPEQAWHNCIPYYHPRGNNFLPKDKLKERISKIQLDLLRILHLEIGIEGCLITKLYDKRDYFNCSTASDYPFGIFTILSTVSVPPVPSYISY